MKLDRRYKKTAPTKKIVSRDGYKHYRDLHKSNNMFYLVKDYAEFSLIARTLFKNIAQAMINKSGGVYMKGLGYFCVWMSPVKTDQTTIKDKSGRLISFMNFDEPYRYNPHVFIDSGRDRDIHGWSMERSFHREIKRGISKNLRNYKPYTFHWSFIKRMFIK